MLMNQIQVWQLHTDTSLLHTWELSHRHPSVFTAALHKPTGLKFLSPLWKAWRQPIICESWAELCAIAAKSTMGECSLCAPFQTLSQSLKRIFISLSSPVHGEAWGRGQPQTGIPAGRTLWSHAALKSGMIFLTSRRLCHPRVCCVFQ